MQLPYFQSPDQTFGLLQTRWKSILDPVIANTLMNGNLINNFTLVNGNNVINHQLGRMMIGWMISDINAAATIYRSQPMNNLTLTLNSNAGCVVDIWVF